MKIMVRETVSHFHEVELSDELDIERVLNMANALRRQSDSGCEAIETVLIAYQKKHGDGFNFEVTPDKHGTICELIEFEDMLEE